MAKDKAKKGPARDKAAKFVELGQKRVGAAIAKVRLVRNLANRSSYDFDKEQVAAIVTALQAEVDALAYKFATALKAPENVKTDAGPLFTFGK